MKYDFTPFRLTKNVKFDNANDFLEYGGTVRTIGASQIAQWLKNPPSVQEIQETWVQSLGWEDPLEEGHGNPLQYSCLENPWTEESGRLQSMGWQRVRPN